MGTERVRSKVVIRNDSTITPSYFKDGVMEWIRSPGVPYDHCVKCEWMSDIVGDIHKYNPVSHVKLLSLPSKNGVTYLEDLFFGGPRVHQWQGSWMPIHYSSAAAQVGLCQAIAGSLNSSHGFMPDGEASAFTRTAFNKVIQQIPEEISIANFLLELKDVKSLLVRLQGLLRTVADGYLAWNFGWSPIIGDLKKLLTTAAAIDKRLTHLVQVNKRTVTISYEKHYVLVDDNSPAIWEISSPPAGQLVGSSKINYHDVKVRQHIRAYYDLELNGVDLFISSMCAALGLNNPGKILWNAIPFSFVVDWLTNLSDFLTDATVMQPFKGKIAIRGAACSFRVRQFIGHYHRERKPLFGDGTMQRFADTQLHGYFRRNGSPDGTIDLTGLTPFQQSLALAVVASNWGGGASARRIRKRVRWL